jgi:hypothetical protein
VNYSRVRVYADRIVVLAGGLDTLIVGAVATHQAVCPLREKLRLHGCVGAELSVKVGIA